MNFFPDDLISRMDHANSLFMGLDRLQRCKRQDRSSNEIERDKLINEREAIHRGTGEEGSGSPSLFFDFTQIFVLFASLIE